MVGPLLVSHTKKRRADWPIGVGESLSEVPQRVRNLNFVKFRENMDFSTFGDENWDVKSWVNSAFRDISKGSFLFTSDSLFKRLTIISKDLTK